MTKKTMLILFAVLLVAVFLAACHPHRRHHRGCDSYGPFGADPVRSQVSETDLR